MVIHQLRKIIVNYDKPVEEFAKLKIKIPKEYVTHRSDFYSCSTCGETNSKYNDNWNCVSRGHSIQKSSRPNFQTNMLGPFELKLEDGINSLNFSKKRSGIINFEVSLFEKHPGVGYPRAGKELLEAIKIDGYEHADIWQLVEYFKTYPEDHISEIVAAADRPVALCYDRDYTGWTGYLKGLSLKLLDFPKSIEYVSLALAVKINNTETRCEEK